MTDQRRINISQPRLGEEEWLALKGPLESGWLTQGPRVADFEKRFAERHQTKHAIAVTSCTTALHLILVAMGIGPGDEVIVPAFTWVATANVVLFCGAEPVLVDIDPVTFNIDPKKVAQKITPQTKAIIAVHLFGLCAEMDALRAVAGDIPIIEDAACAAGASYKGRPAGAIGLAAAFSFHPRKSITTGEGGMITTNSDKLAEMMGCLRNHGASISEEERHRGSKPYILPDFNLLGFNYRMTDLQGAVGLVQLSKLDIFIDERAQWAQYYSRELANVNWLRLPNPAEGFRHGWQSYVCYVDPDKSPVPRNGIMEQLQARGIATRPGTHAVHMLGYYRDRFQYEPENFPAARDADLNSIAIPLHNKMSPEDYEHVVRSILEIR